ncbi:hypothetical protein [Arthrobacter sp. NA-172]|uniref:hypothetical protein n=1 Tax=Arthrobacter sp. NA-172 TaxID=3367524 RepID=UPI0037549BC7
MPPPPVQLPGPTTTTAGYPNPGTLPQSAPVTEPEADPWPEGAIAEDPFTRDRSHRLGSAAPLPGNDAADAGRWPGVDPARGESR